MRPRTFAADESASRGASARRLVRDLVARRVDPRRVRRAAPARATRKAASAHVQPQLGFDECGVRRHGADRPAAARALGSRRPALVRLPGLARVPQPLRRDARRRARCCGSATTRPLPSLRRRLVAHHHVRRVRHLRAYPAIPPWLASCAATCRHTDPHRARRCGTSSACTGRRRRVRREEQVRVPGRRAAVAPRGVAVPGHVVLLAGRRRWRVLLVAYTLAMAFTLVYTRRPLRVRHPRSAGPTPSSSTPSSPDRVTSTLASERRSRRDSDAKQ